MTLGPKKASELFWPMQLTLARQHRSLTKTKLAEAVGVTASAIGQYENGESKPSAIVIARIAEHLDYPLQFFTRSSAVFDDRKLIGESFFRSLRRTPQFQRDRALAIARLFYRLSQALEQHIELPELNLPTAPIPRLADSEAVEEAAAILRDTWNVSYGPIHHLINRIERNGVLVVKYPFDTADLSAFSRKFPSRPMIVLGEESEDAARTRFSAAHELGHLVMHSGEEVGTKRIEDQAHRFASAFLMPADEIREDLTRQRLSFQRLAALKQRWGVSMAALLYRARELDVISEHKYHHTVVKMSSYGWRRIEPSPLEALEEPQLLRLAVTALDDDPALQAEIFNVIGFPEDLRKSLRPRQRQRIRFTPVTADVGDNDDF